MERISPAVARGAVLGLLVFGIALACGKPSSSGPPDPGVDPGTDPGIDREEVAADPGLPPDIPEEIVPGEFGAPCLANPDCRDGFCVEGVKGFFCTRTCVQECPLGWLCRTVAVGSDVVGLCFPEGAELCRPCEVDTQCGDGLCLAQGNGRFCGKDCSTKACPTGYRCQDAEAPDGAAARECVPEVGTCDCTTAFNGAQRACILANPEGACVGLETCDGQAWSGCTAKEPAPETCNGADDDCDGIVDPPDSLGCTPLFADADKDGFGDSTKSRCQCGPTVDFPAAAGGDCDETGKAIYPGAPEVCNGLDDNCSGVTDEGVASPCGGCQAVCTLGVGQGASEPFAPNPETSQGLGPDGQGGLILDSRKVDLPFLWIANSDDDTVSKLNTKTGCEVARYRVCDDPSRTAVDLSGSGIIACRGDGRVARVAVFPQDCPDRNQNGKVDTSADANGDCRIQPSEMPLDDECLLWMVKPDAASSLARAAGVDRDGNLWIGMHDSQKLLKLAPDTGALLQTIQLQENPYGLAIDQAGTIWVVAREPEPDSLVQVDPANGRVKAFPMPATTAYGLAIDPFGKIWVASGEANGLQRFDPVTATWTHTWAWSGRGSTRGVAASVLRDAGGAIVGSRIYVAHNSFNCLDLATSRWVSVVDAQSLTPLSPIDLGGFRGPVGVAIDFDGFLWTVNMCEGGDTTNWPGSASRVDTTTGQVLGTFPVGKRPYTYSDMTGYALKTITAPQGYYRHLFAGWQNGTTSWRLVDVVADLPGSGRTYLRIRLRALDTPGQSQTVPWLGPFGPFPPAGLPLDIKKAAGDVLGRYVEVEVTLVTDDPDLVPTLRSVEVLGSEQ